MFNVRPKYVNNKFSKIERIVNRQQYKNLFFDADSYN